MGMLGQRIWGPSSKHHGTPGFAAGAAAPRVPAPTLGTTGPSRTSLDEDPCGPGLLLAGVPQVLLRFLRGPGAERGERQPGRPPWPFGAGGSCHRHWLHRSPPYSRQEILHFLHGDVPRGVQRVLHAAVRGVNGARREGGRVLLGGPWGTTGMGGLGGSPWGAGPTGTWPAWQGQGDHSRSLSVGERRPSGLCGTCVPFACGSFGVAVKLLLEGNAGRSYCRCRGAGVEGCCPWGMSHLRQEVSWSRAISSRHSGSVTFLALSEKRSNSDGEIK